MKYEELEEVIQKQQAVIEEYENKIQSLSLENEKLHTLTDLQEVNVNTMFEKTMELRKQVEKLDLENYELEKKIADLKVELGAAYENRVDICKKLADQKAEIERLTEENDQTKDLLTKTVDECEKLRIENRFVKSYKKQVDELTDKLGKVSCGIKADELLVAKGVEQAVKDTAKDLLIEFNEWINGQYDAKLDTYSVHIPVHEVNDFLTDKAKEYDVEVE